ncbi:MAG: TetR/AcrR family transcriptional regulator [Chloroflexi bacterium]|nr:TetR/AcrR family transcriptional regulator [Chloroflexota bacterium]
MARPKKNEQQTDLRERIMTAAWAQIANDGAPALSLRAIARDLHITAPAIYNYFPDRDALVTALIVAAFDSFADAQETAVADLPSANHKARLLALGQAYRTWAITYPERYQLIFGTPIAGYHAPLEITGPAAARSLTVIVDVLAAADAAGELQVLQIVPMPPEVDAMLCQWQSGRAANVSSTALYLALMMWAQVHGLVSLEIGGQFPSFVVDSGALYQHELARLTQQLITVVTT